MPITITQIAQGPDVVGAQHIIMGTLTMSACSGGAVDTGLSVIYGFIADPQSAASSGTTFKPNFGASGTTAVNGSLYVTSAVTGDVYNVIITGK